MTHLWHRGECYTVPLGWDVFQGGKWTFTRYSDCWLARRVGFRPERIAA